MLARRLGNNTELAAVERGLGYSGLSDPPYAAEIKLGRLHRAPSTISLLATCFAVPELTQQLIGGQRREM